MSPKLKISIVRQRPSRLLLSPAHLGCAGLFCGKNGMKKITAARHCVLPIMFSRDFQGAQHNTLSAQDLPQ